LKSADTEENVIRENHEY